MQCSLALSFFQAVILAHIQVWSSFHSQIFLKMFSRVYLEVCLLGDSKSHQVDNRGEPSNFQFQCQVKRVNASLVKINQNARSKYFAGMFF